MVVVLVAGGRAKFQWREPPGWRHAWERRPHGPPSEVKRSEKAAAAGLGDTPRHKMRPGDGGHNERVVLGEVVLRY